MYEDFFDGVFSNDEEIDDAFNSILSSIGEQIEKQEQEPHILNPVVVQKVCYTYKYLRYLFRDEKEIEISYELNAPFVSMGSASVIGESIVFSDSARLSDIVKLASNIEVYSRTDGKTKIDFTFHGAAISLK